MIWFSKELDIAYPQIISASREARDFCKKGKLIYIKISTRWAQSGFCNFKRLEMRSETMKAFIETKSLKNIKYDYALISE